MVADSRGLKNYTYKGNPFRLIKAISVMLLLMPLIFRTCLELKARRENRGHYWFSSFWVNLFYGGADNVRRRKSVHWLK